jgi:electron transport complex protein RnfC
MSITPNNSQIIATSGRELSDFHGGIHPAEMKKQSSETPITKVGIPPKLVLPLQQHIGQASKVLVGVGQQVKKGQLLAEADGYISVGLHAPSSGVIESIEDQVVAHPSGQSDLCITIATDGQDEWCELDTCEDYLSLDADAVRTKVRAAGIAGMGGAGFPSDVKINPPKSCEITTLVLNAAECEPYITADDRLMRERAVEVIEGLKLLIKVLGPKECLIGIEDNKPEAIRALQEALANTDKADCDIEICVAPTKYPSGGEKQLIKILTGKEVPSGKIPADIGIVCHNVGTVVAMYRAVRFGEPLISRITTLTGQQIGQRGNVEVLLGTPISWLLSQYDYKPHKYERLIMGGPMMGFNLTDSDVPVVKTTNCILAPDHKEMPLPEPAQACIRCGLCAEACPAELLPQQLYWFARGQEYEKAEHHNLFDCIECGACSFVCPSSIPLVQYYRHAKGEIKQQRADQAKSDQARERFEARQARLEQEAAEKAAKRKARAEAAAKAQAEKKAKEAAAPTEETPTVDAKKAAVAEAIARAEAKKAEKAPGAEPEQNPEELKDAWDKAQSKLDKMLDALESAKENNPENVEKLTRAVEKNQMRVNQAKQAWEKASKEAEAPAQEQSAIDQVAVDELQVAFEKAESKLAKMQDALDNAQPEQVEKLTRAVDKNKVRVEQAKQAWEDAKKALAEAQVTASEAGAEESKSVEPPDLAELEVALEKAESKLIKMEDALANAQPEQVEKLTRAVDKNKVRVEQAKQALEDGKKLHSEVESIETGSSESKAEAVEEPIDIGALEVALEKAESKLMKMEDALANAQPEQVEKLTRAVNKNKQRVKVAQEELDSARAAQEGN